MKPRNNKIRTIKNLILNTSVVNLIVKSRCNGKTLAIKNKIFGPFRFVKQRFRCISKKADEIYMLSNLVCKALWLLKNR